MRKAFIVGLCFFLLLCFCIPTLAEPIQNDRKMDNASRQIQFVNDLFNRDYTVVDKAVNDVTDSFYAAITPMRNTGNFEGILSYIMSNSYHGHTVEVINRQAGTRARTETVTLNESHWEYVDDSIHGYQNHNIIYYDIQMTYEIDYDAEMILSASKPIVSNYDLMQYYGDLSARLLLENRAYSIASNNRSVTYSFRIRAYMAVYSNLYPEINMANLSYYYQLNASITKSVAYLREVLENA